MITIWTQGEKQHGIMRGEQLAEELAHALAAYAQREGAILHAQHRIGNPADWEDVTIRDVIERARKLLPVYRAQ